MSLTNFMGITKAMRMLYNTKQLLLAKQNAQVTFLRTVLKMKVTA
jgi:hypothetical protein